MVLDYYKLREQPFGVTPDCRYLYASATHREALASLLYGVESKRGFVALIAEPGMGKTTLIHSALRQIQDRARTAFLFQTIGTPEGFLRALLRDFGIEAPPGGSVDLQAKLNDLLVEQSRLGKPLVVVVDEAQNLDDSVLELLRMLSNFESPQAKLLQIVLSGQPQLAEKLSSRELVQLRQRISIVARLKPFSHEETALYINHRLRTAGYSLDGPLFTSDALGLIAEHGEGIPRNINNLCFNALSLGCALKKTKIDSAVVNEVIGDLDLEPLRTKMLPATPHRDASPHTDAPVLAAALQRPVRAGWPRKLGFASAVLLALCGVLLLTPYSRSNRWASPAASVDAASVQAASVASAPAKADSSSLQILEDDQPEASFATYSVPTHSAEVRVAAGQTLYRICTNNFGKCNGDLLQEIQKLNPQLRSLSHVEPGWTIRIPTSTQIASHRIDATSTPEKGTP